MDAKTNESRQVFGRSGIGIDMLLASGSERTNDKLVPVECQRGRKGAPAHPEAENKLSFLCPK